MSRSLNIYYTTDIHGFFSPVDYGRGVSAPTGLSNCMTNYVHDGNSLVIDGGDTLQGSPFTFFLTKKDVGLGSTAVAQIASRVLNIAGYDFVTLGNHDFNYGHQVLQTFIDSLDAEVLCANVQGLKGVQPYKIVVLENGLKVGLVGITTQFINVWEKPENLVGITVTDPVPAAIDALAKLKAEGVDLTIGIYHSGYENDVNDGRSLSTTGENKAYEICMNLGFDILLTGHQHIAVEDKCVGGTFTCQTPDKASRYIHMTVDVDDNGTVSAKSKLMPAGSNTNAEATAYLAPFENAAATWFDTPVGHLDTPLLPGAWIDMAANGSYIANFFNQVQLEASGADISCASLANEVKGFNQDVTIRDVVATYIYPNTLYVLEVDRGILKQFLERCAEYFDKDANGNLRVSRSFLEPKVEHYNYDFITGLDVVIDVRRPVGDRVLSIKYKGEELDEHIKLKMAMNNYRASGTGGYEFLTSCPVISGTPTEIAELIMEYIATKGNITVDKHNYLTVIC